MSLIHEALEKVEQEKVTKSDSLIGKIAKEALKAKSPHPEIPKTAYAILGVLALSLIASLVYFLARPPRQSPSLERKTILSPTHASGSALSPFLGRKPFTLTGITQADDEWNAIVNNRLVRVGDEVNGAKVESIEEGKVVLRWGDETVSLTLE